MVSSLLTPVLHKTFKKMGKKKKIKIRKPWNAFCLRNKNQPCRVKTYSWIRSWFKLTDSGFAHKGTNKEKENSEKGYRNRSGETLFIDARNMGSMVDRTHKELTNEDIAHIANTYHAWRGTQQEENYSDEAGYCKSASLADIQKNDYVLTPGRYVGVAEEEDDGIPFEDKMKALTDTLMAQMQASEQLDADIKANLKMLGYE